jgi:hypothetical protein
MEPLQQALQLLERQSELENAIRRPGGIRRPVDTLSAQGVESADSVTSH